MDPSVLKFHLNDDFGSEIDKCHAAIIQNPNTVRLLLLLHADSSPVSMFTKARRVGMYMKSSPASTGPIQREAGHRCKKYANMKTNILIL